jgi:hypothetical protein
MTVTNNPSLASYLAIENPLAVAHDPKLNQLLVATSTGLHLIKINEKLKQEQISSAIASTICYHSPGIYLINTDTGLIKISSVGAELKKITEPNSKGKKSKLKVLDKYFFWLIGTTVWIFDLELNYITNRNFGVTEVTDVEYFNGYLYVSGFQAQKNKGVPVQVGFVYRLFFDGKTIANIPAKDGRNQGKLWGFKPTDLDNDMADTRVNRLCIDNGNLYLLGSVYGGNSIFRWNGLDLQTSTLVVTDENTNTANTRDETKLYAATLSLDTFTVAKGQVIFPRKSYPQGPGNTIFPKTLYIENEKIFIGSACAAFIPNRDTMTFLNKPIPTYRGDASFEIVDKNYSDRTWFTPGNGDILLFNSKVAVVKTKPPFDLAVTQPKATSQLVSDTFLIVW